MVSAKSAEGSMSCLYCRNFKGKLDHRQGSNTIMQFRCKSGNLRFAKGEDKVYRVTWNKKDKCTSGPRHYVDWNTALTCVSFDDWRDELQEVA